MEYNADVIVMPAVLSPFTMPEPPLNVKLEELLPYTMVSVLICPDTDGRSRYIACTPAVNAVLNPALL